MKTYVAGFCFDDEGHNVVLIFKKKPKWQKDKMNGIGGSIEPEELTFEAMVREFKEETTVETKNEDWDQFIVLYGDEWVVHFFRCFNTNVYTQVQHNYDFEEGTILKLPYSIALNEAYKGATIPNLRYLLPLAVDKNIQGSLTDSTRLA